MAEMRKAVTAHTVAREDLRESQHLRSGTGLTRTGKAKLSLEDLEKEPSIAEQRDDLRSQKLRYARKLLEPQNAIIACRSSNPAQSADLFRRQCRV